MPTEHDSRAPAEQPQLAGLAHELVTKLNQATGEDFSELTPQVVRKQFPGLYTRIVPILPERRVGEKPWRDWRGFYEALQIVSPTWAERWETPERKREKALDRHVGAIVTILQEKKWTGELSPSVIQDLYGNYEHLLALLPANGKRRQERNWLDVEKRLGAFAPLWVDREKQKERTLKEAVEKLVAWLEATQPTIISPGRLKDRNPDLCSYVVARCRNSDNKIDWNLILNHTLFPQKWRGRWRNKRSGKFNPEDVVAVRSALARENPPVFDPEWIKDHVGIAAQQRIFRRLPRRYGAARWEAFLQELDRGQPPEEQWGEKWHLEKVGHKAQREVQAVLDAERENLAVFVTLKSSQDREKRDGLINTFVTLAQHGNVEAQKTLWQLLMGIIKQWARDDHDIAYSVTRDPEDAGPLEQTFARCVAQYKPDQGKTFLEFLHANLKQVARIAHGRSGGLL